ncbi:MAG: hypothetical protein Q9219_004960 [cf. Caloplaca sp. 3 TL-2023]
MLDFVKTYDEQMGSRSWIPKLAQIFAEQGLVATSLHRFPLPPELYQYDTDCVFGVYEEVSRKVLDPKGQGEGEKLRNLISAAYLDSRQGVAICHDKIVVIGQKPKEKSYKL